MPKELWKGNEALAEAAIRAGCEAFFGYPITPQNEIPEMLSAELPKRGGEFVQAESEVAAANMLLGAAATGVRAMTSSSSPGVSLMQEAISYQVWEKMVTADTDREQKLQMLSIFNRITATVAEIAGTVPGADWVGCGASDALQAESARISANATFARRWSLFIILSSGRRKKLKL